MKKFWHGFRKRDREPIEHHEKSPANFLASPELAGLIASIAVKVIGSTVKDRMLRAVLTAIVAGLGAWFGFSSSTDSSQQYSLLNIAVTQPRSAPVAATPGYPRMAAGR